MDRPGLISRKWRLTFCLIVAIFCDCYSSQTRGLPEQWFLIRSTNSEPGLILVKKTSMGTLGWSLERHRIDPGNLTGSDSLRNILNVYEGGPVETSTVCFLYIEQNGAIHFSRHIPTLNRILINDAERKNVRVFGGYYGWRPGQLEAEFRSGIWSEQKGNVALHLLSLDPP